MGCICSSAEKEIPYLEDTVLDVKKTSIYADDDENVESENKEEDQQSWFESLYKSQKKDYIILVPI